MLKFGSSIYFQRTPMVLLLQSQKLPVWIYKYSLEQAHTIFIVTSLHMGVFPDSSKNKTQNECAFSNHPYIHHCQVHLSPTTASLDTITVDYETFDVFCNFNCAITVMNLPIIMHFHTMCTWNLVSAPQSYRDTYLWLVT